MGHPRRWASRFDPGVDDVGRLVRSVQWRDGIFGGGGGGGGDDSDAPDGWLPSRQRRAIAESVPFFEQSMFFDTDVSGMSPAANERHSHHRRRSRRRAGGATTTSSRSTRRSTCYAADASTPHQTFTQNGPDWAVSRLRHVRRAGADGRQRRGRGRLYRAPMRRRLPPARDGQRMRTSSTSCGRRTSKAAAASPRACLARWDTSIDVHLDTLRGDAVHERGRGGVPDRAAAVHGGRGREPARSRTRSGSSLPNDRLKRLASYRPATHGTSTTGGADAAVVRRPPPAARGLPAREPAERRRAQWSRRRCRQYGMYQADGGNIALTARDDRDSTAKWADVCSIRTTWRRSSVDRLRRHRPRQHRFH